MNRTFLAGITAGGLVGMAFARRWHRTAELPPLPEPVPYLPPRDPTTFGQAAALEVLGSIDAIPDRDEAAWLRIVEAEDVLNRAMPEGEK